RWMMSEAPHHAVLVVDRHEGVAVECVVAIGRDHGVKRHDPLRDPPVKLACRRRPPHADHHAAAGLDYLKSRIGLAGEFCALADSSGSLRKSWRCRKDTCTESMPPSSACSQLQSCVRFDTKRCVAGTEAHSKFGSRGF